MTAQFTTYLPLNWTALSRKEPSHFSIFHAIIYFLQENGSIDTFDNFRKFALLHSENSLKFSKEYAQPFSRKKINCPMKFGNMSDVT